MRNRPMAVFGLAVPFWEGDVANQSKIFFLLILLQLKLYPWLPTEGRITNTIWTFLQASLVYIFLDWTCLDNYDKQGSGWGHLFQILKRWIKNYKDHIFAFIVWIKKHTNTYKWVTSVSIATKSENIFR